MDKEEDHEYETLYPTFSVEKNGFSLVADVKIISIRKLLEISDATALIETEYLPTFTGFTAVMDNPWPADAKAGDDYVSVIPYFVAECKPLKKAKPKRISYYNNSQIDSDDDDDDRNGAKDNKDDEKNEYKADSKAQAKHESQDRDQKESKVVRDMKVVSSYNANNYDNKDHK